MPASAITVEQTDAIAKRSRRAANREEGVRPHRARQAHLGYAYLRGSKPAVEVLNGDGSVHYFAIKTKADLSKAIGSMRRSRPAARKAAAAAKKAS